MTATSAGSRPTSAQCRRSTASLWSSTSGPTAGCTRRRAGPRSRRVRRSPPPPTMTGTGPPGAGSTWSRAARPAHRRTPWCRAPTAPASSRWPISSRSSRSAGRRERQPERRVLALPPAGPDPAERPAAGERVQGGDRLGDDAGRAEGHRRDTGCRAAAGCPGRRAGRGSPRAPGSAPRPVPTWGIWIRWSISASPAKPGLVGGQRDRRAARPAGPRPTGTGRAGAPPRSPWPARAARRSPPRRRASHCGRDRTVRSAPDDHLDPVPSLVGERRRGGCGAA